ncbi:MAG: hypothetical protein KC931_22240, partial [Candidatus Omnitrophica bacterium]|nr:hypothetical protein [Candidatus Omnitrophota bacterium]
MSWDVVLLNFQGDPPDTDDLSDAFNDPPAMGDAAEIREKVSESLPGVDWSDPAWGVLQGDGWSIEFNHQETGETATMMLHVRGGGDPITSIA